MMIFWIFKASIKKEHPELDGRDMPTFYKEQQFEKIINHNIDDLKTSESLSKFLKKTNPELLPFD